MNLSFLNCQRRELTFAVEELLNEVQYIVKINMQQSTTGMSYLLGEKNIHPCKKSCLVSQTPRRAKIFILLQTDAKLINHFTADRDVNPHLTMVLIPI